MKLANELRLWWDLSDYVGRLSPARQLRCVSHKFCYQCAKTLQQMQQKMNCSNGQFGVQN